MGNDIWSHSLRVERYFVEVEALVLIQLAPDSTFSAIRNSYRIRTMNTDLFWAWVGFGYKVVYYALIIYVIQHFVIKYW